MKSALVSIIAALSISILSFAAEKNSYTALDEFGNKFYFALDSTAYTGRKAVLTMAVTNNTLEKIIIYHGTGVLYYGAVLSLDEDPNYRISYGEARNQNVNTFRIQVECLTTIMPGKTHSREIPLNFIDPFGKPDIQPGKYTMNIFWTTTNRHFFDNQLKKVPDATLPVIIK